MAIPGLYTKPRLTEGRWETAHPCLRCASRLGEKSLSELAPGSYSGLCEVCERETAYSIDSREGYTLWSHPPHHPSWSRHREGFWGKAGCSLCAGLGRVEIRTESYGAHPLQCAACRPSWMPLDVLGLRIFGVTTVVESSRGAGGTVSPPPRPAPAALPVAASPIEGIRAEPVLCGVCSTAICAEDYPVHIVRRGGRLLHARCVAPPEPVPARPWPPKPVPATGADDYSQLSLF